MIKSTEKAVVETTWQDVDHWIDEKLVGEEKDRDGFEPVKLHPPQKWGVSQIFGQRKKLFPFFFSGYFSTLIVEALRQSS